MASRNGESGGRHRVVLLGGKALAIQALESVLRMPDVEVAAVVPCADDDPAVERWYPSLARYARDRGLPVHQPASVNDEAFFPVLQRLRPDVLLSIFYDKILKPRVLRVPAQAAANVHFGLLPYNRGSFPIPWAIIDGNDPGVTMHHMDHGVDTGDLIAQMAVPVSGCETARDVYGRCAAAGLYLIEQYLPLVVRGEAPRRSQQGEGGSYYRPGYPFDRWVDWSQSAETLCRFVRALTFPPFPGARTWFKGREPEVCHPVWPSTNGGLCPAGTIVDITPCSIAVGTGEGALSVRSMRLEGEELPAAEVLRRLGCRVGDVLEGVPWIREEAA